MLDTIKNEIGFSNLSYQSQKLLMIPIKNEEELLEAVKTYAGQTIKRQTVITCMDTLFKNSNNSNAVSCLVIGTENGWVHIIDSEAFTILDSVSFFKFCLKIKKNSNAFGIFLLTHTKNKTNADRSIDG